MPTPIGNFFMKTLVNSLLHPLLGKSIAVITFAGSKTGKSFQTRINVVRVGEALMVISMRNRTWWRNLHVERMARLRHIGRLIPMRGEVVETPAEVAASLADYFTRYPGYAKYFDVGFDLDGKPDPQELESVARERVIIKLQAA